MRRFPAAAAMLCIMLVSPAPGPRAWDGPGHRTIACLALAAVDLRAAPWLGTADIRDRILFQSNQPDRLRSRQSPVVRHLNAAEHYFEIDSLHRYGLTLASGHTPGPGATLGPGGALGPGRTLRNVPPLRRAYVRAIVLGSEPSSGKALPAVPPQYLLAGPGFLAHGAMEAFDLLTAALHQVRILEALGDPRRDAQLEQSRADVIHALGRLSHLVGDGAQPLHTTRHFNGWAGSNPDGYTRSRAFHRQVDSMPGRDKRLSCTALLPRLLALAQGTPVSPSERAAPMTPRFPAVSVAAAPTASTAPGVKVTTLNPAASLPPVDPADTWRNILTYLKNTYAQVEPLYTMERDGRLEGPAGRAFVAGRLLASAAMLAALLQEALDDSEPTAADITRFLRWTKRPSPKEKPPARDEPGRRRD